MTDLVYERGPHRLGKNHGFLIDELINQNGEFYSDQRISVALVDRNKHGGGDSDDD